MERVEGVWVSRRTSVDFCVGSRGSVLLFRFFFFFFGGGVVWGPTAPPPSVPVERIMHYLCPPC